jgi:hypothetical protein
VRLVLWRLERGEHGRSSPEGAGCSEAAAAPCVSIRPLLLLPPFPSRRFVPARASSCPGRNGRGHVASGRAAWYVVVFGNGTRPIVTQVPNRWMTVPLLKARSSCADGVCCCVNDVNWQRIGSPRRWQWQRARRVHRLAANAAAAHVLDTVLRPVSFSSVLLCMSTREDAKR